MKFENRVTFSFLHKKKNWIAFFHWFGYCFCCCCYPIHWGNGERNTWKCYLSVSKQRELNLIVLVQKFIIHCGYQLFFAICLLSIRLRFNLLFFLIDFFFITTVARWFFLLNISVSACVFSPQFVCDLFCNFCFFIILQLNQSNGSWFPSSSCIQFIWFYASCVKSFKLSICLQRYVCEIPAALLDCELISSTGHISPLPTHTHTHSYKEMCTNWV